MKHIILDGVIKDWYFDRTGYFITPEEFKSKNKTLLKEYISELLDPEDNKKYGLEEDGEDFYKTVKIGGDTFEINAIPSHYLKGVYRFSFKLIHSDSISKPSMTGNDVSKYVKDLNRYSFGLTNTGNPIKVLKYIQSVVFTFIKKYSPAGISFKDYDEGGRSKVYGYMAKKLSKMSGYFLIESNHYFFLFRDKEDIEKFKKSLG